MKKMLKKLPFYLCLNIVSFFLLFNCSEERSLSINTHFIEPGDFSVEGFLDKDNYQFLGILADNNVLKENSTATSNKKLTYKLRNGKAGKEYSLFLARLAMYDGLFKVKEDKNNGYFYINIPGKTYIVPYLQGFSYKVILISHRIKQFLQSQNIREEIVFSGRDKNGRFETVLHARQKDLYYNFTKLPRTIIKSSTKYPIYK